MNSYRDTMKCPEGHKRIIVRSIGAATRALAAARRIKSYCVVCHRSYYVTPGKPPQREGHGPDA